MPSRAADRVLQSAKAGVRTKVAEAGGIDAAQHAGHGLAWLATTVEGLRQMHAWGSRLSQEGRFGEFEQLILVAAFAEYLAQIAGGIPMSQVEIIRADALGIPRSEVRRFEDEVAALIAAGSGQDVKSRLAELIAAQPGATTFGDTGLDDTHAAIHEQMRKFSEAEVVPHAHEWHLKNEYIPLDVIAKVAELGVFGLTMPEEYGGLGLGKESMCIVSEELSRGYIGVGSLGTRSEIAGELILNNGTDEQKSKYLPKIATGELLPTAVFTEPNTGSDLASLKTRAVKEGDTYKVTGQKTWITHPVRADLMTLLVRTNPNEKGYKGLSMLLAEKPRGTDEDPFPAKGMTGGEIEVLGYRGMKEYDISFDAFEVPAGQLLGGVEGQGFKQLMNTFEAARIQTAARAVGVAQCAMDLALKYALDRNQFGKPIYAVPARVQQDRDDGGRDHGGAPAHLFCRAREGPGTPLRSGSRHGEAPRRTRRLGECGQRAADPRRQRLRARVSHQPCAVRLAHPQHLRGRGRDPGAGDHAPTARRRELTEATSLRPSCGSPRLGGRLPRRNLSPPSG